MEKENNIAKLYWLHALTPLHVGAGRGVGFIDLPVAREKVTGWPVIPGSAIKGVLADHHGATDALREPGTMLAAAFGRVGDNLANSGALIFTDARIVCLPVRSLYGTFAWVTSPMALRRLARDLSNVKPANLPPSLPELDSNSEIKVHKDSVLGSKTVFFEDLDFTAEPDDVTGDWADFLAKAVFPDKPNDPNNSEWQSIFPNHFAVVTDDVFNFLCETATEVNARVKIEDETKTVTSSALWYEENLPAETLLAGLVSCGWVANKAYTPEALLTKYCEKELALQMGGKATTGKGMVRCVFQTGHGG